MYYTSTWNLGPQTPKGTRNIGLLISLGFLVRAYGLYRAQGLRFGSSFSISVGFEVGAGPSGFRVCVPGVSALNFALFFK